MKKVYLVDYDSCNLRFCGRQFPIWVQKSTNKIRIDSESCLKCGVCANVCPAKAIYVKSILDEPTELVPTHKYPNVEETEGFRLYNLPTLISGKVSES